ncbi:MAG: helix-turn-helix transcriptional regulator [Clostridia bacterium]|nr:helix-turn-helix transcriptional regulator [Clostridia bacterium]
MIDEIMEVACPAEGESKGLHTESYDSAVQIINAVHKFLVSNLKKRYTIEDLSVKYHINQTTLKTTFKTVFGQSIGGYMKEYRIKQAKDLLCHSDSTIAEIACAVGYENQSKFTAAFRDITGILPRDYRKAHMKK